MTARWTERPSTLEGPSVKRGAFFIGELSFRSRPPTGAGIIASMPTPPQPDDWNADDLRRTFAVLAATPPVPKPTFLSLIALWYRRFFWPVAPFGEEPGYQPIVFLSGFASLQAAAALALIQALKFDTWYWPFAASFLISVAVCVVISCWSMQWASEERTQPLFDKGTVRFGAAGIILNLVQVGIIFLLLFFNLLPTATRHPYVASGVPMAPPRPMGGFVSGAELTGTAATPEMQKAWESFLDTTGGGFKDVKEGEASKVLLVRSVDSFDDDFETFRVQLASEADVIAVWLVRGDGSRGTRTFEPVVRIMPRDLDGDNVANKDAALLNPNKGDYLVVILDAHKAKVPDVRLSVSKL